MVINGGKHGVLIMVAKVVNVGVLDSKNGGFRRASRNLVVVFMFSVLIYRPRGIPTYRPCVFLIFKLHINTYERLEP